MDSINRYNMYNNKMWIVEPTITKKVVDYDIWTKDDYMVTTARYWRWAEVSIDSQTCPEIDLNNTEGINILSRFKNEYDDDTIKHDLFDCYDSVIVEYPKNMRSKLKDQIYDIWETENTLVNDGWFIESSEIWVYGKLSVREI